MAVALNTKKNVAKSLINPGYFSSIAGDDPYQALAQAEMGGYEGLGASQAGEIGQFASDYGSTLANRRDALAKSLSGYASGLFEQQNPAILEDLNRRGLFTSPTAVAHEQASALKDIALETQNKLMDFDLAGYGKMDEYGEQALGARLGGQTQGLESAFELGRGKVERSQSESDAAREEALARSLAQIEADSNKKAAKMQMWGSIVGGGLSGLGALCFDPETEIEMSDGSKRKIQEIWLGDKTKGGEVISVRKATVPSDRYDYFGVVVTGSHAVYEAGKWLRVRDSKYANPVTGPGLVCSIVTKDHRIYVNGITFADEWETDRGPQLNEDESLAELNAAEERENGDPA